MLTALGPVFAIVIGYEGLLGRGGEGGQSIALEGSKGRAKTLLMSVVLTKPD